MQWKDKTRTTSSTPKPIVRDTLQAMLIASVGTKMFQHVYVKVEGKQKDVMQKGELSCAFYVSSMLSMFGLIDKSHATVRTTEKKLMEHGWKRARTFKFGNVLIWDATRQSDGHQHIGFYLGNQKAISNSSMKKVPHIHHVTYQRKRPVLRMYCHDALK